MDKLTTAEPLIEDASRVLPEVCACFANVVTSLPGFVRRPRDVSKVLGIHQTLAWKIMKVVDGKDPFAIVRHIPGRSGVERFLTAAQRAGAPEGVIERTRAAMEEFQRLIATHAESRAALELTLGASAREVSPQTDLPHRKAGFQCASYTWGVQARTRYMATICYPDENPERMRFAIVAGYVGLHRIRPNTRWTLWHATVGEFGEDGITKRHSPFRPIDPDGVLPNGVPLLRDFCSNPVPAIERVHLPSGEVEDQWMEGPVGERAAITCFTAEALNDTFSSFSEPFNEYTETGWQVRTPVEGLVLDFFAHRDLFGGVSPELFVYSELGGRSWHDIPEEHRAAYNMRLSASEKVQSLGQGLSEIHTADVPRCGEMMRFVLAGLDCEERKFDVYRVRMEFPVVATAVTMRLKMPARP